MRRAQDRVRLIRGSHIVLPALYEGDQAYILQNDDRRVVFVIPYEGRFSLVGTTDVPHEGDAARRALHAGGSGLSLRRRRPPVPRAADAGGDRLDLFRRAAAARRRRRQPLRRHARLRAEDSTRRTGQAPVLTDLWRQDHHLSAAWPRRRWRRSARALGQAGTPWTAGARCRAAISAAGLPAFEAEMARRHPWLAPATLRPPGARLWQRPRRAAGRRERRRTRWARITAPGFTERELDWLRREGMGAHRRGRAVAPLQARPAHGRRGAGAAAARLGGVAPASPVPGAIPAVTRG